MGKNVVALFRMDDFDAVINHPHRAVLGIQNCVMSGKKNDVSIPDEGVIRSGAITVMPVIDSREAMMYMAMENGIHAVTTGSIQRNPLLLENLLRYLKEDLYMKIQKNPFE